MTNAMRREYEDANRLCKLFEIPQTVRYPQAMAILGVSKRTVQRMVKSKKLRATRLCSSKGLRIYVDSIIAYREEREGL